MLRRLNEKRKRGILAFELIGIVIMLTALVYRINNPQIIEINMDDMHTDYTEAMVYNDGCWTITDEIGAQYKGSDYILYSPDITLKNGSYTLCLEYITNGSQRLIVESKSLGGIMFNGDTEFVISKNKNYINYDFDLTNSIDDFRVRLLEYPGNFFSVSGLRLIRNTHDIRRLFFLWIIISIILNSFLFNVKFKNNHRTILAIIGIGILASFPLFARGIIYGHDIQFHLVRIEGIANGLKCGCFPVKMYPIFNDGYGYPTGIYYGDLLLYIPALLRIVGFSVTASYKLYVLFLNVLIAALAFICGKTIVKKDNIALIFSMVYSLSNYRLVCAYVRQSIAEYAASGFYLLIVISIWNIYNQSIETKKYSINAVILAAGMSGLIYTHILSTQMVALVLTIFALVLYKKTFEIKRLVTILEAIVLCVLYSLAFLIPFLEYYTSVETVLNDSCASAYIQQKGAYISDYFAFFKTVSGGGGINLGERMSLTPGLVLMLAFVYGIYLIIIKQATRQIQVLTYGAGALLFVASNVFPWNAINDIPVLGNFFVQVQFPFRYVGIAVCILSMLCCLIVDELINKGMFARYKFGYIFIVLLSTIGIFLSSLESSATQIYPVDTASLKLYTDSSENGNGGSEYLLDETVLEGLNFDYSVSGEKSEAVIQSENGLSMDVNTKAEKGGYIDVPRFNYPYFKAVDCDGNELLISNGINNKIRINFNKDYEGIVRIDFIEPLHWRVGEMISLVTVIGTIIWILIRKKKINVLNE